MALHGVISHLLTRKPTKDKIGWFQEGLLQSLELTENTLWEPYSTKFAETEAAAHAEAAECQIDVFCAVAGVKSKDCGLVNTKEILVRHWGIGLDTAHHMLIATTQQFGIQRILHPASS